MRCSRSIFPKLPKRVLVLILVSDGIRMYQDIPLVSSDVCFENASAKDLKRLTARVPWEVAVLTKRALQKPAFCSFQSAKGGKAEEKLQALNYSAQVGSRACHAVGGASSKLRTAVGGKEQTKVTYLPKPSETIRGSDIGQTQSDSIRFSARTSNLKLLACKCFVSAI